MDRIDHITLGVIAVAAVTLAIILLRKGKKLRLLDLSAMPRAKLRSKKMQILENRLFRKAESAKKSVVERIAPLGSRFRSGFHALHTKIEALEWKYRNALHVTPRTKEEKEQRRVKIAALMEQGAQFMKEENYIEAEKMFLEVIRLSPKSADAYESLGEVYYYKADYDHAIETLQFVKKLDPESDRIECDLGLIFHQKGDTQKALRHFQESVKLSPNNPRNLDYLLQAAIAMKRKYLAQQTIAHLQEVNPENQKLAELQEQIAQL